QRLAATLTSDRPESNMSVLTVIENTLSIGARGARSRGGFVSVLGTYESLRSQPAIEITKALAARDPDRAELFARAIIRRPARACALAEVALAIDEDNPSRSQQLFTDAERLADSDDNKSASAVILARIAEALARDSLPLTSTTA